jgi:hypothetical protein
MAPPVRGCGVALVVIVATLAVIETLEFQWSNHAASVCTWLQRDGRGSLDPHGASNVDRPGQAGALHSGAAVVSEALGADEVKRKRLKCEHSDGSSSVDSECAALARYLGARTAARAYESFGPRGFAESHVQAALGRAWTQEGLTIGVLGASTSQYSWELPNVSYLKIARNWLRALRPGQASTVRMRNAAQGGMDSNYAINDMHGLLPRRVDMYVSIPAPSLACFFSAVQHVASCTIVNINDL